MSPHANVVVKFSITNHETGKTFTRLLNEQDAYKAVSRVSEAVDRVEHLTILVEKT